MAPISSRNHLYELRLARVRRGVVIDDQLDPSDLTEVASADAALLMRVNPATAEEDEVARVTLTDDVAESLASVLTLIDLAAQWVAQDNTL